MSKAGLSKAEIKKRLVRLRNIEFLHEQQRFKIWHLRDENRELRQEIKRLNIIVSDQQKTIDDMKLQIEELRVMVFGKKKKKEVDDDDLTPPKERIPRSSDSYKRPIPKDAEVTEIVPHPMFPDNLLRENYQKENSRLLRRRYSNPHSKDCQETCS